MSMAEPMTERHGRLLAAFAARAARLTEVLAERAEAAEDPAQAADLARAFHAVGRSLRQAIFLEQRLEREAAKAQRESMAAAEAGQARSVQVRHKLQAKALRERAWTEFEAVVEDDECDGDEAEAIGRWYVEASDRIDAVLERAVIDPETFLAEPFEAQLERLTRLALPDRAVPFPYPSPVAGEGGRRKPDG
jgi:hypothetical protein